MTVLAEAVMSRSDRQLVEDLEGSIGRPIELVDGIGWDTFGAVVSEGRVVGLGLYGLGLTALPAPVCRFLRLRKLNLTLNSLTGLPDDIAELADLEELACAKNGLTALPEAIGELRRLRVALLGCNAIQRLPETFVRLSELRELDINDNLVDALPEAIGEMRSLRVLNVGSNRLMTLSEPHVYRETPLRDLEFDRAHPPRSPFDLQALVTEQRFNEIELLPDSLGELQALERLAVVCNGLRELPSSIVRCSALRELELSHNRLRSLPEELGRSQPLTNVDLRWNELRSLPTGLVECPTLQRLNVDHNPL